MHERLRVAVKEYVNLSFDNGYLHLNDTPGLGVDFDINEAAKYPYKRSYLPVSRLKDGTLWDW